MLKDTLLAYLTSKKNCKANNNCKASIQKCEKLIFEEILPDLAQTTKMAISQPLVDLEQNPLGVKSYLAIGIHPCHSHPIPRFDKFSLFLQWLANHHIRPSTRFWMGWFIELSNWDKPSKLSHLVVKNKSFG